MKYLAFVMHTVYSIKYAHNLAELCFAVAVFSIPIDFGDRFFIRRGCFTCNGSILWFSQWHYNDVIMSVMASQITSLTIVYSTLYSGADQRKYQSSASLAFVWGKHQWPVNSPHKGPVTRKIFPFDDVIMIWVKSTSTWPQQNAAKHEQSAFFREVLFTYDHHDVFIYWPGCSKYLKYLTWQNIAHCMLITSLLFNIMDTWVYICSPLLLSTVFSTFTMTDMLNASRNII